jgi:hypothetical protein
LDPVRRLGRTASYGNRILDSDRTIQNPALTDRELPAILQWPDHGDVAVPSGASALTMDERERLALEREVQLHLTRVEELLPILKDLEENLQNVIEAPHELLEQIVAIKMELRGRMAAIAMGEARLGIDTF